MADKKFENELKNMHEIAKDEIHKLFERKKVLHNLTDDLSGNQSDLLDVELEKCGRTLGQEYLIREKLLQQLNGELCEVNTKLMTILVNNCHKHN